ncbi:hypothetical protein PsYK624_164750 [Phanerochaete sordida]|uniref:BTB domain-containing protein n=1 Tax=Phanerochaete sordida TaxID=48140 RepID=A0A9P3LN20_9APHY|nr:hypothetical protein PsYK624_164750 [Phanerochaete sordida]
MKEHKKKDHSRHVQDTQTGESSSHARKKRRIEEEQASREPPPLPPKHEQLWFDDGNVAIISRDTSFRLHRSVLEQHSSIISDLLECEVLDANPGDAPSFQACIVLRADDSGAELARLLRVLYSIDRSLFDRRKPVKFLDLRGIALLAHKYNVHAILNEVSERLSLAFPAILEQSDIWIDLPKYIKSLDCAVHCTQSDLIGVVDLATRLDFPAVRVMGLYHICRLDPSMVWDGVRYGDEHVQLPLDDLRLIAVASRRLCEANTRVMSCIAMLHAYPSTFPRDTDCMAPAFCTPTTRNMLTDAIDNDCFAMPAPLDRLDRWIDEETADLSVSPQGLCPSCSVALKQAVNIMRHEALEGLGEIFGVQPWPPAGRSSPASDEEDREGEDV